MQIKSCAKRLLIKLDRYAQLIDYDPRDHMLERIGELEQEIEALKAQRTKA